ncbi:MAG: hypothetical protein GX638_00685 [Crenarchaeota archaeon]|nr:hypothetical protein [Thermoproteota archaeon]
MENLIPTLYKSYGTYVNSSKMIPSIIDGTIPVWKRILLGAHTVAKTEFVKSAAVFGHVIANWHPHSEAIQGTAEILIHNGFLDGKGNWGSTIGIEPMGCAAPRYTSIKMNPFMEEMSFKYVKDVVWREDELNPEPVILPTMIPICLFTKYEFNMIGFGFKTEIPSYKLSDLIKRLMYLLKLKNKIIIKPNIVGCKIVSADEELEKLLIDPSRNSIQIKGTYTEDRKNFRIYVHGWSPRSNFSAIFNRIDNYNKWYLLSRGDVSYIDESTGSVGTKIRFEVAKARNRDKIYDQLLEAIEDRLTTSISYQIFAVLPDLSVKNTTVDEMLMYAYNNYITTLNNHFTRRIKEVQEQIDELKIIDKIKPHLQTVLKLKDPNEMIQRLSDLTKISINLIENVITKYNIKKLLSVSTDLTNLVVELDDYKRKITNIEQVAIENYKDLLQKIEGSENKNKKTVVKK